MQIEKININELLSAIRQDLVAAGHPLMKESSFRFFKEPINCYGVKVPVTREIGKKYLPRLKDQSKEIVFSVCERLWKSGIIEESIIACLYCQSRKKQFEPGDFKQFENWINKYVNNWASCDTFCNHSVGDFLQAYPEYLPELKKWAKSKNRWMRRASAVSLIVPASKGLFPKESLRIASILLQDSDDLVQKGYGWLLKAVSKCHQKLVFDFIMENKGKMPRTALRYAIEKMPPARRQAAMA